MPQQPKITGDQQVDSWALQVTQELNDVETPETTIMLDTLPAFTSEQVLSVEIDGETYYWTAAEMGLPPFLAQFAGIPADSNVYATQADFTVNIVATAGVLDVVGDISVARGATTITPAVTRTGNAFAYTGSDFAATGTYSFTSSVSGMTDTTPPVAVAARDITGSFERFVPAFWSTGPENTPPTTLPLTNAVRDLTGFTATGSPGQAVYYLTSSTSNFRFNDTNGFEIFEERRSTIDDQTDTAGVDRDYIVYELGIIGSTGVAQFVLAS